MTAKRILVLYTGGTIGMERSDRGYVPVRGLGRLLAEVSAQSRLADLPDYELLEYDQPIDSADVRPAHWRRMAGDIARRYPDYDGFVVMHGTDTMAYTASALSFLLQGLRKPVLITGSQIPLREVRNDAQNNFITALILAARYPVPEVCLYFNGRLLRGNRSRKLRADRFDAFDSPNYPPLGEVGIKIEIHRRRLWTASGGEDFQLPDYDAGRVVMLKVFPGIDAAFLERVLALPLGGLVLECYGVGNAPQDPALLEVLAGATRRGLVVVSISQCLEGRVDPGGYAAGSALARAGVVGGLDLTPEAAFTKLHHLLALGLAPDAIRQTLVRSLCGECSASGETEESGSEVG